MEVDPGLDSVRRGETIATAFNTREAHVSQYSVVMLLVSGDGDAYDMYLLLEC